MCHLLSSSAWWIRLQRITLEADIEGRGERILSASDYIQLLIAIIAGVGAIFAFLNIRMSNKQINLQQKQWEHSHVPIFRISYLSSKGQDSVVFVIENPNNIFHQIEQITFSSPEVKIESSFNGFISKKTQSKGEITNEREYHGLMVKLIPLNDLYYNGILQLRGYDALGNEFKANSNELIFKNRKLENHLEVSRTYFKQI